MHRATLLGFLIPAALLVLPAAALAQPADKAEIFGVLADGRVVHRYVLHNSHGMSVVLLDRGAMMASIKVPGRDGTTGEVLLTPGTLPEIAASTMRFGAVVGRYAGRLGRDVPIAGKRYTLAANAAGVTLHGGDPGFDSQIWDARSFATGRHIGVEFSRRSPAGEQGFPGSLDTRVRYALARASNTLTISFAATTDAPTVVNLTNHAYYDLSGRHDLACQVIQIDAHRYVDTDRRLMPTGAILPVAGTSLDATGPLALAAKLAAVDPMTKARGGFNDTLVMDTGGAVRLWDARSRRTMIQRSDGPAVVIYTANNLAGNIKDAAGTPLPKHGGVALEAQGFPDSPNQPSFPSTLVTPTRPYHMQTVLTFDVDRLGRRAPDAHWRRPLAGTCGIASAD